VHLNIPIAHLHGGELSGSVDDNLRHSITKLSHIHFVSNEDSRKRVIQLGENPKYVINVGAPSLDTVLNEKLLSEKETRKTFKLYDKKYLLLVFHPTTTDIESPKSQIKIILNSLFRCNYHTIAIKSNTDAGGELINNELAKLENKTNFLKVFSNIPYIEYLSLLKYCTLLIGNSSSGIIEAPSFKIPVINIGNRQKGRVRAKNIYDVRYNEDEIFNSVIKLINAPDIKKELKNTLNPYGNGKASSKITLNIKKLENKISLINKNFYNLI
jgi:GDP/UDP-N,N'-diacetylbacillosamine 2-epimerase (hydrolysing)